MPLGDLSKPIGLMGVNFWSDTRAVSEVVGAILLFGILILALTSYQAAVVPSQNAQTEFEHNQDIEDEMVDLRNAVLEAQSTGTDTFASIKLGTRYRDRVLAINPTPATGTLQTVEQENISVTEAGGQQRDDPLGLDDRPLENQFIEYTPNYFEYRSAGTVRYENTLTYHQFASANITLTDQRLLQGDRVTLAPIEGTVSENGIQRVTVEPVPGVLQTVRVEDPVITVPTKLSEDDWTELLVDELSAEESLSVTDGNLILELDGIYRVTYSPIGANQPPREGERGGSSTEINPAAPGNVQLVGAQWDGSSVILTFRNSADNSSFTEGRVNFFFGNSEPTQVNAVNAPDAGTNPRGSNWEIGGDFKDLDPDIFLEGDQSTTRVEYVFDENLNRNQDFFVTTLTLESGERATYFVGGEFSPDETEPAGNSILQVTAKSGNNNGGVLFSVENTGSADAVIEGISVDSTTSNNAVRVERTGNEFERTNGVGARNGVIEIDGNRRNLDTDVTIAAGTEANFFLGQFRRANGNTINMNNVDVTITFYLSDGTERQLVLTNP